MSNINYKVNIKKSCADGNHTFIPVAWKKSPSKDVCTLLACQHCLTTADKYEQEVMSSEHNKEAQAKAQKNQATE